MTIPETILFLLALLAGVGCSGYGVHMGCLGVRSFRRWRGDLKYTRELGREPQEFELSRPGSKYTFLDIETSANRTFFWFGLVTCPVLILIGANALFTAYTILTEGIK